MCYNGQIMRKQAGFTAIELVVSFILLVTLAVFFVIQRNNMETAARDQTRKTAVNAMYYSLTEVYYKQHKYYPQTISRDILPSVDPTLFTDPDGFTLDGNKCTYTDFDNQQSVDGDCNYQYTPSNCDHDGHCQQFKLTADMEAEANFTKTSLSTN